MSMLPINDFGRMHKPCGDCDEGHCTMNCSTPRANDQRSVHVTLQVAAYWPNEGYGGGTPCETMAQAENEAREYEARGYGAGSNRIHIIRTTREIIEWDVSPENRAKLEAEEAARLAKRNAKGKRRSTKAGGA